jgi:hypothetical protein
LYLCNVDLGGSVLQRLIQISLFLATMLLVAGGEASAGKVGAEFRVGSTAGHQATVAPNGDGGFVVVWASTSGSSVYGQRYRATGARLGAEFLVNRDTYTSGIEQPRPRVVALNNGGFIVAWTRRTQFDYDVFARRFSADGLPLGAAFRISTASKGTQIGPEIAVLANGNFVVTWSKGDRVTRYVVCGRLFSVTGTRIGNEFCVAAQRNYDQYTARVAARANGGFVVAWISEDGSNYGQFYTATGARQGEVFRINPPAHRDAVSTRITSLNNGGFVAFTTRDSEWADEEKPPTGQYFGAAGAKSGPPFTFNQAYALPEVAALRDGGFIVTWFEGNALDRNVFARLYRGGAPVGGAFQVNSAAVTGMQTYPAIAALSNGRYVVVWESYVGSGPRSVRGQLFSRP